MRNILITSLVFSLIFSACAESTESFPGDTGTSIDSATSTETATGTMADSNTTPDTASEADSDTATTVDTMPDSAPMDTDASIAACEAGDTEQCPVCPSSCLNAEGNMIEGCGDTCGGIYAVQCPNEDLKCINESFAMYDGGTECHPSQLFNCQKASDCLCLPQSLEGCGWEFRHDSRVTWRCISGECVAECTAKEFS
ncbi:MAG: hypothetical protein JXR76_03760 [Deltaproteobacteria bacterium]|nr:hypothetical protein [Deltaproteobacteria bacterium]